jgi:spermidine synthase
MDEERLATPIVFGVALVAFSTLLLEITLTRIFAVTLWYHFGALAISLALMGTAAAAVLCYVFPERLAGEHHRRAMALAALSFAVSAPIAIAAHIRLDLPSSPSEPLFYAVFGFELLLLFLTFFFSGLAITIGLFHYSSRIGRVYFFDLLGASLGSLLVVPLLYEFSAPALVLLASAVAALAGLLFARAYQSILLQILAALTGLVFLTAAVSNDSWELLTIDTVKSYGRSLQRRESNKVFEKWSPVSRIAVFAPRRHGGRETMHITNDAGAPTRLVRFDGDFSETDFLDRDSRQIVHHLKQDSKVLIIGSAGGTDVLAALKFGQRRITAVEINPVIGELVTTRYADYIGRIFQDPRVSFHVQEGRNFTAGSKERYDIIQITMIDSWGGAAAGAYVFNENALYTLEAIKDYVTRLEADGILSITRYYEWDEALRLTNTFVEYLNQNHFQDVDQRVLVILERKRGHRRATVLLKNGIFTQSEVAMMREAVRGSGASVIYAPFMESQDFVTDGYAHNFRDLIQPGAGGLERAAVVRGYPRDIRPSTDNRPFFFFNKYLRDAFKIDPTEHAARRMALPLLYGMLGGLAFISLLTVFLPLYLKSGGNLQEVPFRNRSLIYFASLGVGFMLIEISLIQRLTIFLGHPTWSFVVVLATLLCASGLGSLVSERFDAPRGLARVLAGIVVLLFFYVVFIYDAFIDLMFLGKPTRVLLAIITIAPPGFLMGMCFPMGMRIARQFHPTLVPWGWGVNGACSVFASILAIALAMNAGFKATIALGILCYFLALLLARNISGVSSNYSQAR